MAGRRRIKLEGCAAAAGWRGQGVHLWAV